MSTFYLILSLPFWIVGVLYVITTPFSNVFVNGVKNPPHAKIKAFVFGLILIAIGWLIYPIIG